MRLRLPATLALTCALAASPGLAEPRPAGLRPAETTAEGGLWALSERAEADAKTSADLNTDPALGAYVREVACKVASAHCGDIRVYVMDRPFFNAMMAPNGYSEVWSGLLLRSGSEAELAFALAHEVSHFTENHTLDRLETTKTRANAMLGITLGLSVVGAAAAGAAGSASAASSIMDVTRGVSDVVYLGVIASLFGFSREQEIEADQLGLERIAAAGYRPSAAPDGWRSLIAETQASDFPRVRRREARTGIFDSHPVGAERVAYLTRAAAQMPAVGEEGRARHRAMIRPHLSAWLRDDLRKRDFGQTLTLLARLAEGGEDLGVINFYRGEAYRLRRGDGDAALALAAYEAAIAHPDAPAAAWRELGDLKRKAGDGAGARAAYQAYLERAPQAEDAWVVKDALNKLEPA